MKNRSDKTVDEIAAYVAKGFSQSPSNCRVLLDEISRLREENNRLRAPLWMPRS